MALSERDCISKKEKKLQRELSPAGRCYKNHWHVGSILKAKSCYHESLNEYWKITAIGQYLVLGMRVMLPPYTTSGEEVMHFDDSEFVWRRRPKYDWCRIGTQRPKKRIISVIHRGTSIQDNAESGS
jgi:hypothetical protein